MSAPLPEIVVVPLERLTSREQFMACVPLGGRMRAAVCVGRQARVHVDRLAGAGAPVYPDCVACDLGVAVRARVGDAPPIATAQHAHGYGRPAQLFPAPAPRPKCARPGCVHTAGGPLYRKQLVSDALRPFCSQCRASRARSHGRRPRLTQPTVK